MSSPVFYANAAFQIDFQVLAFLEDFHLHFLSLGHIPIHGWSHMLENVMAAKSVFSLILSLVCVYTSNKTRRKWFLENISQRTVTFRKRRAPNDTYNHMLL